MNKILVGAAAVILGLVVIVGGTTFGSYNSLVSLEESVDAAWSQVENVYQRRADLVPNLVATVRGSASFERETLQAVVDARAQVGRIDLPSAPGPEQLEAFEASQAQLSSALSRLLVVVERYPELRTTEAFRDLMVQLEGAENRIAVERRRFNEAAQAYNSARRRFPTVLVASLVGFERKAYFEAAPGSERAPKVDFSDPGSF
jgi:LemA protein